MNEGNSIIPHINRLPIIVEPYSDELFSSWIFRLALANGTEPYILFKSLRFSSHKWYLDLDATGNIDIINAYANITNINISNIQNTLMHDLLNNTALPTKKFSGSKWLIPLNNKKDNRIIDGGIHFCPSCLEKYRYFKKIWRLAISTCCIEHKIKLKAHCQKCKSPVHLKYVNPMQKNFINSDTIFYCSHCGFDLRKSHKVKATDLDVIHNQINQNAVVDGYIIIGNIELNYSHLYFKVVDFLISLMFFRENGYKIFDELKKDAGTSVQRRELAKNYHIAIKNTPLKTRNIAFRMAYLLLSDFPNNLISNIKLSNQKITRWHKYQFDEPFWFSETLNNIYYNLEI